MARHRKKKRAGIDALNLSFLDAISCGFGAIVVLLVLTKMGEPEALAAARDDLDDKVAMLQDELTQIRSETIEVNRRLVAREESVEEEKELVEKLRGDLSSIQGEFAATEQLADVQEAVEGRLVAAQQTLTEEMKRLLGKQYRRPKDDSTIGGIPVDSEYVIFVIDRSGSMTDPSTGAWPLVVRKMQETLEIYPEVKGVQVLSDAGLYMFGSYARKWIPDTPNRRRIIVKTLRNWGGQSDSSPVKGIQRAIQTFVKDDKKISIYVFGDDFMRGGSVQGVLDAVRKYNKRDDQGRPLVRIHAVGFPTGLASRSADFANLMRELCHENDGTFVGLNDSR